MAADFRGYAEVVFENPEDTVQSWHIDGHNFFVVGYVYLPSLAIPYDFSSTSSSYFLISKLFG